MPLKPYPLHQDFTTAIGYNWHLLCKAMLTAQGHSNVFWMPHVLYNLLHTVSDTNTIYTVQLACKIELYLQKTECYFNTFWFGKSQV